MVRLCLNILAIGILDIRMEKLEKNFRNTIEGKKLVPVNFWKNVTNLIKSFLLSRNQ